MTQRLRSLTHNIDRVLIKASDGFIETQNKEGRMEAKVPPGVEIGSAAREVENEINAESNTSCVTWSAVLAGAAVSAALGLILLALGTGLGLSSVSL